MATIKDVAKEAGLTVTTVSRVLNNRGYISDDARKKVSEAMAKLNYQPNEVARSLHKKSSNTIGLIVPYIRHPYFAEMISNIEHEAFKLGYRVLICNTKGKEEKEREYLDICTGNRVAGIIVFSGTVSVDQFSQMDVPVITMERTLDSGTASVECDNKTGGELAAKRLIEAGCKNLLMIGSTTISDLQLPADNRSVGFRTICEKEGIPFHEVDPHLVEYENMEYGEFLEEAFKAYPGIDGIFASSDVIAAQTLQACNKLGIRVPEQLKLIGFDDSFVAILTTPRLTTIHQPTREMAAIAVKLLKDAVEKKLVPKQTILPVSLIERGSVSLEASH